MSGVLTRVRRSLRLRYGRPYLREANLHRDRGRWIEAVIDYRRALDWLPWRDDLHIQIGNCLKEYGDYPAAVSAYSAAAAGSCGYEARKQIADASRRGGYVTLPYSFAEGVDQPASAGEREQAGVALAARDLPNRLTVETLEPRRWLGTLGRDRAGAGAAMPLRRWFARRDQHWPSITFDQVGSLSLIRDGVPEPLLAGVVAIRLRIVSTAPVETVELWLGEGDAAEQVALEPVPPGDLADAAPGLHVANIWIDAARLRPGRRWLAARAGAHAAAVGLYVNVADPDALSLDLPNADAYVPSPPGTARDPAAAVIAAPALARPASRTMFDRPVRSILAVRADQLGDVSASLPAMARLRTLFPQARLTVLVQPAVAAVVAASGLADEVLTIALSYDPATESRYLSPAEEARVRALCAGRGFDLAIDLCPGDELRPLLLLSGATYLVGFDADRFGFLDYGISVRSRDKANQLDMVAHAAAVMTLVEGLAVAVAPARRVVPRVAPVEAALAAHGLAPGRYVVLHTGARHAINRWPVERFGELAGRILADGDLDIVVFGAEGALRADLAPHDRARIRLLELIDGDAFDAIIASARLVIGNDSGPKHLAAVRGVPTVSLHVGRLNWNEWGQDGQGVILSKRVPCAGCGLNDIRRCGRDAVCLRSIAVEEVLAAARPYL